MPAKATKGVKAGKTGKAGKVTKASKPVKPDDARKAGKRNVPPKVSRLPAYLVDKTQLPVVENVSPKLDSLMSVALVQTAVAAVFFDVIWLRKVFPNHNWQARNYDPSNPNNSYQAYVEGDDFVSNQYGYDHWHVPKRGEDSRVDKLMDTLESCAKEPIEKHWLKKLQLCFHMADGNKMTKDNLIEAYSLTFEHYKDKVFPQLSTHGKNVPVDEPQLTLLEGRQTLRVMIDKLFQILYDCDNRGQRFRQNPLPEQFRMIFVAEYNESAPKDYQPSYFKPGNTATSDILSLCERDDRFVMDTGYHLISAGLRLPGPEGFQSQTPDISTESMVMARAPVRPFDRSGPSGNIAIQYNPNLGVQRATVDEGTQLEAVNQLEDVGLSRGVHHATQDTQQIRGQRSSSLRSIESQSPFAPPYTQEILNHLRDRLSELTSTNRDDDLDEPQGVGFNKEDSSVKCECQCQMRHEIMIYCVQCQQLQHAECYGYLDQKAPENHLCYSCLAVLRPLDKPQLDIAADMCIKRLTLRFLHEKQVPVSYEALVEFLGRSLKSTASIVEHLLKYGLVQVTSSGPGYTVRYTGNDETLSREYFRPQKHINSLFTDLHVPKSHNSPGRMISDVRDRTVTEASFHTPIRTEDFRLPTSVPSQRHTIDDGTTQGEPSPQSAIHTPTRLTSEVRHLRSIAQRGLNLGPGTPKRHADHDTSTGVAKRLRTSRTSPFLLSFAGSQ